MATRSLRTLLTVARSWVVAVLACIAVGGCVVTWLASAASLAARASAKLEDAATYGVLVAVLALLLVRQARSAIRKERFSMGLWGATCIWWLAAGPGWLTEWWPLIADTAPARFLGLLLVLVTAFAVPAIGVALGRILTPARGSAAGQAQFARDGEAPGVGSPYPLERSARHEAAHAVAALALGGYVYSVDVRASGGIGGACRSDPAPDWALEDQMWARLVVSVAGNVVDLSGGWHDLGATNDLDLALRQVAAVISIGRKPSGYAGPLRFDDLLAGARDIAHEILDENGAAMDALTERLVATAGHRTLLPKDLNHVREMVRPHRWQPMASSRGTAGTGVALQASH